MQQGTVDGPEAPRCYRWHLREVMTWAGMFRTSDLVPLLAERGVALSRGQVFRLVTRPPQRLTMTTLMALCDIFHCTPNDLITPPHGGEWTPSFERRPRPAAAAHHRAS